MVDKIKRILKLILFSIIRGKTYYVKSINDAKKVILTDIEGYDTDYRWSVETKEEADVLSEFIREGFTVCDFGIGVGRVSKELVIKFNNIHLIGIDASDTMLEQCKKYIPESLHNKLQLVPFRKMNEITSGSIDFVFSIYTLQHIPAGLFEKSLVEIKRMLKPGGYFYLLNGKQRWVVDGGIKNSYEDGLNQLALISKHFEEVQDVPYNSDYMKKILKQHFSKLFRAK